MGQLCKKTVGTINVIETGKTWPNYETLEDIANALGCEVLDMFAWSPAKKLTAGDAIRAVSDHLKSLEAEVARLRLKMSALPAPAPHAPARALSDAKARLLNAIRDTSLEDGQLEGLLETLRDFEGLDSDSDASQTGGGDKAG